MRIVMMIGLLALASCGGGSDFTCSVGSLTGTWRFKYQETNGTCGALQDETIILGTTTAPSGCTTSADLVSADHCRLDTSFTCPIISATVTGTQTWTETFSQVSAGELSGSGTASSWRARRCGPLLGIGSR